MKIALMATDDFSIWQFRRGLIRALRARKLNVYVICSSGPYVPRLISLGACHIPLNFGPGISLLKDITSFFEILRICRRCRFDLLQTFTIKPNIYGAIAGWLAGCGRIIAQVSGRGSPLLPRPGLKGLAFHTLIVSLYKIGLKFSDKVWFQNSEDANYFQRLGIVPRVKAVVIRSGGIDTEEYFPGCVTKEDLCTLRSELGLTDETPVVAMVARNNWRKGVREFIEASELCRREVPNVRFLLMTLEEENMDRIPHSYLKEKSSQSFQWLGRRDDVKTIMALSSVVVLPSYYGEGVPHSLIEAMALGKPIITTDNVGCREVIEDNKNGLMVPPKDSRALSAAIKALISDRDRLFQFGRYSRAKVEKEFSDEIVLQSVFKELYRLPGTSP